MVYVISPSTPANTPQSYPLITSQKLSTGLIYHVEVYFPPGPSGLLGVAISAGGHQLYPEIPNTWFIGNDISFKFDDLSHFDIGTQQIDVYTYNNDSSYAHECLVMIGILTDKQFQNALAPETSTTDLVNAIDKLTSIIKKQMPTGNKPVSSILG